MSSDDSVPSYNYCALPLMAYACRPDLSRGRIVPEADSAYRTPFQRDRDRIIHSAAFRRLKYKTQVFVYHEGDHYRTRLTHTIEVAQIARTLARALMVNEDLAESVALAHDLGHTPFAHMGEDVLKTCMAPYGGFEHNDQSLRVLVHLEHRYAKFRGLNLSYETLEGVVKHNGPVTGDLPCTLAGLQQTLDLRLSSHAPLEAQVAAIADDIAYNNHDVEDGLRAGFFTLEDLRGLALYAGILPRIEGDLAGQPQSIIVHETIRDQIGSMIDDVLMETRTRLSALTPRSPDDIRGAGRQLVAFSPVMEKNVNELRRFLFARMYKHYTLNRIAHKVQRIVTDLFTAFMENPALLPDTWQETVREQAPDGDFTARARVVADYIAGMTDRFAIREHERLFDLYWDLK